MNIHEKKQRQLKNEYMLAGFMLGTSITIFIFTIILMVVIK